MAKLTPQQFREKHARNLKNATEDMRIGIDRVTESPTAKAAQKADKMLKNLTASIQSGKWQQGLNRVSLDDWKTAMLEKGVNRVAAGIDAAAGKVEAFAEELLPYVDSVQSKVNKMPDTSLEDNIARAATFMREMAKFKRSR